MFGQVNKFCLISIKRIKLEIIDEHSCKLIFSNIHISYIFFSLEDDWLVDDIGEQLATKKTKKNNQYIREKRSPDRHYKPQRDSSSLRSPVRVSSPSRSPMRDSPSKSPVRRFSPLRSPERNSSPLGDIGSPVISSRISSPSKDSDSRVSSPIYPRAESPVRDQSWVSRLSKLKVKNYNSGCHQSMIL